MAKDGERDPNEVVSRVREKKASTTEQESQPEQYFMPIPRWIVDSEAYKQMTGAQFKVYVYLWSIAVCRDDDPERARGDVMYGPWGQRAIAEKTGVALSRVVTVIRDLEELGLLEASRGRPGQRNTYHLYNEREDPLTADDDQ